MSGRLSTGCSHLLPQRQQQPCLVARFGRCISTISCPQSESLLCGDQHTWRNSSVPTSRHGIRCRGLCMGLQPLWRCLVLFSSTIALLHGWALRGWLHWCWGHQISSEQLWHIYLYVPRPGSSHEGIQSITTCSETKAPWSYGWTRTSTCSSLPSWRSRHQTSIFFAITLGLGPAQCWRSPLSGRQADVPNYIYVREPWTCSPDAYLQPCSWTSRDQRPRPVEHWSTWCTTYSVFHLGGHCTSSDTFHSRFTYSLHLHWCILSAGWHEDETSPLQGQQLDSFQIPTFCEWLGHRPQGEHNADLCFWTSASFGFEALLHSQGLHLLLGDCDSGHRPHLLSAMASQIGRQFYRQPTWQTCVDQRLWQGLSHQQPSSDGVASYHIPSKACQLRMGQIGLQHCWRSLSPRPLRDAPDCRPWSDSRHCTFLEDYQESCLGCALCSPRLSSRSSSASTHSTARMEPTWSVRWKVWPLVDRPPWLQPPRQKECNVWSCCGVAACRTSTHETTCLEAQHVHKDIWVKLLCW